MAFRMREPAGGVLWAGGSHRTPDGRVRDLAPQEIQFTPQRTWRSPHTQIEYPVVSGPISSPLANQQVETATELIADADHLAPNLRDRFHVEFVFLEQHDDPVDLFQLRLKLRDLVIQRLVLRAVREAGLEFFYGLFLECVQIC